MKNLRLFVVIFSFFLFCFPVQGDEITQLLEEIDELIEDNSANENKRDDKIMQLKEALDDTDNDNRKFEILESLFRIYRSVQIDSAYLITKEMNQMVGNLDEEKQLKAKMRQAEILLRIGRPSYAVNLLDKFPRTEAIKNDLYFYQLYYTAYSIIEQEEKLDKQASRYAEKIEAYTDTILYLNSTSSITKYCAEAGEYLRKGQHQLAIEKLQQLYQNDTLMKSYDRASIEYLLAEYYLTAGDTATGKIYYAKSVLSDFKRARKVYKSLPRLAMLCHIEKDTERAYKYITRTMYDITYSHARYRILDIAEYMPIITEEHDKQNAFKHKNVTAISIILSILLLTLIVFYGMLKHKNGIVALAEKKATAQNAKLQELSENLKVSNERIRESDQIKDEYIAMLFKTCSEYIHEQETFKKKITRKLATGQVQDVMKFIDQQSSESDNFKQFIRKFDVIFNSIFPTFVDDFNQLLRPEEQIHLKPSELLTPELRIYALIRLGITENAKIANFLHYSLQTVYNYRQRMRNKAIDKSESLSEKMMETNKK